MIEVGQTYTSSADDSEKILITKVNDTFFKYVYVNNAKKVAVDEWTPIEELLDDIANKILCLI